MYTQHIHTNVHSLGEKEGQIEHEHIIIRQNVVKHCWLHRKSLFLFLHLATFNNIKSKIRGKNVERRRKRGRNGYQWKFSKFLSDFNRIPTFSHQIWRVNKKMWNFFSLQIESKWYFCGLFDWITELVFYFRNFL